MCKIKFILLWYIFFFYTNSIVASEFELIRYLTDEEASIHVNNLLELDKQSDLSINYNPYSSKIDIGIGKVTGNLRDVQNFSLIELQRFFSGQKHKNLIVIWFCKSTIEHKLLNQHVNKLIGYFFY